MHWNNITIEATPSNLEILETLLWDLGAVSVTVTDGQDNPIFEPPPGETPLWLHVEVCGLFEQDVDSNQVERQVKASGYRVLFTEKLADRPWEREWLTRFHPMQFGRRLWVVPGQMEKELDDEEAVVVHLDPGLAFGTGTHATTRLCLEWLDSQDLHGKRVIDYGSGSGILGIAALRLGAADVRAVDNDQQALQASQDNAVKNKVGHLLTACTPDELGDEKAELVIANILAQPLIELSTRLVSLMEEGADLLLSGIMVSQQLWVESAYTGKVSFLQRYKHDDWACLQGRK